VPLFAILPVSFGPCYSCEPHPLPYLPRHSVQLSTSSAAVSTLLWRQLPSRPTCSPYCQHVHYLSLGRHWKGDAVILSEEL
jgi:hypothetical protein